MRRAAGLLLAVSTLAFGGGCSDDSNLAAPPSPPSPPAVTTPEDAGPTTEDATAPAAKPTFPQVLSRGGPTMTAPKVVPIVFAGDPMIADITSFTQKIAGSSYWQGVAPEYGVGAITAGTTIVVNETAPTNITNDGIEAWLLSKLSGSTPAFGAPDSSTLYAIYYPAETTISFDEAGSFGQSCQGYGGYHYEIDVDGKAIGYAVLPRCSDMMDLTVAASHEYFEWATDPFPKTNPAYNKMDDDHWAWQAAMIGELSDLCTFLDRDNLVPPEIGFTVQRHWSNKLALPGGYPCAPVKNTPYLQAIPLAEDDAIVPDGPNSLKNIHTKAIRVPPGGSRTVDVYIHSDKPVSKLVPLRALSFNEFYGGSEPTGFTYDVTPTYAAVGDTVKLTIHAPKTVTFDLAVTLAYTADDEADFWPVLVTNDKGPAKGATPGNKQPIVDLTVTPETMPKRPENRGINYQARKGHGTLIDSFAPVHAALVAERARASLPSSMMSELPRR